MVGVDKTPMQGEYENALKGNVDLNIKIKKLGELNKLAYEDLILSINTNSLEVMIAFGMVRNAKSLELPKGNCKVAWGRLVNKYAPHTTSSLLKLKCEFDIVSWLLRNMI